MELLFAKQKLFVSRKNFRRLRCSYQKVCFCQWSAVAGYFGQIHPWQILCSFRKLNFYTMFRMRLGRKISLVPKFRKIKFKEITGNQFQGTFWPLELRKKQQKMLIIIRVFEKIGFYDESSSRPVVPPLFSASSPFIGNLYFWPIMTSEDLETTFFCKTYSKNFILIYNFPTFNQLLSRRWANLEYNQKFQISLEWRIFNWMTILMRNKILFGPPTNYR